MRHAPAGGLLLLFVLASPGGAQQAKVVHVVGQAGAEVRAMASDRPESYVTNRLKKGDVVEVVGDPLPGGWLRIQPPTGSTSWISRAVLDVIVEGKPMEVVAWEDGNVPVYPAPADKSNELPKVIGARLERGHQVMRRGQIISNEKHGTWVEIESPQSEARFVRADAVERRTPEVVPTAATAPAEGGPMRRSTMQSAAVVSEAEEARRAAVEADNNGNVAEAVRLYDRIVEKFGDSHPRFARMSRERADYLRGKWDVPADPGVKLQGPAKMAAARTVNAAETKGTSDRDRDERNNGSSRWEQRSQALTDPRTVRTYRGWLSVSHSQPINGQKPYLLTLRPAVQGLQILYVVGGIDVGLDGLVGKLVELRGPLSYQGEMRSYVMQVTQASEVQ